VDIRRAGSTLIFGAVLVGNEWNHAPHFLALCWLGGLAGIVLVRAIAVYFKFSGKRKFPLGEWERICNGGLICTGLIWGSVPFVFFVNPPSTHNLISTAIVAGVIAGASGTVSALRAGFYFFAVPTGLPLGVVFLMHPSKLNVAIGLGIFLFIALAGFSSERIYSILERSFRLRYRNDQLIADLQKAKAEADLMDRMRFLGQLTSGVAHEVRNPLNSIMAVTESLFCELGDKPEFRQYQYYIRLHVDRLSDLMQDLLQFGKPIDRSKMENLLLKEILFGAAELWRSSPQTNGCRLELIIEKGCDGLMVHADASKLQQVVLNLLDNAVQHCNQGCTIALTLAHQHEQARILVIDHGIGIPPDLLPRIFEPFFTTRKGGTGLGLAIIKSIIEAHKGTISIRNNEPPPGCTAEIRLPLMID
jgi:signal transduction histidine kinase